jgi:hypothetical protein
MLVHKIRRTCGGFYLNYTQALNVRYFHCVCRIHCHKKVVLRNTWFYDNSVALGERKGQARSLQHRLEVVARMVCVGNQPKVFHIIFTR